MHANWQLNAHFVVAGHICLFSLCSPKGDEKLTEVLPRLLSLLNLIPINSPSHQQGQECIVVRAVYLSGGEGEGGMEGGGYLNYYLTGCAAQGLKPLPYLRIFLLQK